MVKLLLDAGAKDDGAALGFACWLGRAENVQLLLDAGALERLRQSSHGLADGAVEEGLRVVERDHVLVGLDQRLGGARSRHGVGHRQHLVDRLGGVVDEADVGRRLRAARGDVVRHAAQPLRHQPGQSAALAKTTFGSVGSRRQRAR